MRRYCHCYQSFIAYHRQHHPDCGLILLHCHKTESSDHLHDLDGASYPFRQYGDHNPVVQVFPKCLVCAFHLECAPVLLLLGICTKIIIFKSFSSKNHKFFIVLFFRNKIYDYDYYYGENYYVFCVRCGGEGVGVGVRINGEGMIGHL